jgi:hypothetical protein
MTTTDEALAALAAKDDAQRQLAAASLCPPWRHALFGLLMGGFVASPAIDLPQRYILIALLFVAIPIIVRSDRKRLGMFVNGYRKGKTRVVAFALLAIEMALYMAGMWRGIEAHDHVAPLLLGLVGAVAGYFGSVVWQRVFVRELSA